MKEDSSKLDCFNKLFFGSYQCIDVHVNMFSDNVFFRLAVNHCNQILETMSN